MSDLAINQRWDTARAKEMIREMSGQRAKQAMSVAVNDTAKQVERKSESLVAKTLSVPTKRARIGIWRSPASTPSTLTAVVRGSGSQIPLKAFHAREAGDGVTAKIWGAIRHHPGAFIHGGPVGDHNRDLGTGVMFSIASGSSAFRLHDPRVQPSRKPWRKTRCHPSMKRMGWSGYR